MRCSNTKDPATGSMTVAIVDSRSADYATLPTALDRPEMNWHFATSGRKALRLAQCEKVDVWVINTVLPDMSGMDLCQMLKGRSSPPLVYIVTDAYRVEDERAARCCGVSLFACKPVEASWFKA